MPPLAHLKGRNQYAPISERHYARRGGLPGQVRGQLTLMRSRDGFARFDAFQEQDHRQDEDTEVAEQAEIVDEGP